MSKKRSFPLVLLGLSVGLGYMGQGSVQACDLHKKTQSQSGQSLTQAIANQPIANQSIVAPDDTVGASESQGVNITIYNQNFGLVRDTRTIDLKDGINYLRFEDVASQIDPTSVSISSLTAPNAVTVREQNYRYDLVDPNTILSKSIGKHISFKQVLANGQVNQLSGTLLNSPITIVGNPDGGSATKYQGLVVQTDAGIVLNPHGEMQLAQLPPGLVSKPTLLWKLETNKPGKHQTEIAYQTGGLNWKCDYVTVANADDTALDITSWVTLNNTSGATYKGALLKLMAGDVNRVTDHAVPKLMMRTMAAEAAVAPQFKEQSFAEYHLYTLQGKTDVNNNETKQLSLFNAASVPCKKLFIFEPENQRIYEMGGGDPQKVQVKLEFQNTKTNNLGLPMPKGKIRVYKRDQDNALQFVGEDLIDHTAKDEKVRIYVGNAFDVVGERQQTNYQQVSNTVQRLSYEISLRNHKDKPVTVTSVEHAYGQWKILNSSLPFAKKDAHTFEFSVNVPANGEVKLTYVIEIKN